jgi:hypothetical protein
MNSIFLCLFLLINISVLISCAPQFEGLNHDHSNNQHYQTHENDGYDPYEADPNVNFGEGDPHEPYENEEDLETDQQPNGESLAPNSEEQQTFNSGFYAGKFKKTFGPIR